MVDWGEGRRVEGGDVSVEEKICSKGKETRNLSVNNSNKVMS